MLAWFWRGSHSEVCDWKTGYEMWWDVRNSYERMRGGRKWSMFVDLKGLWYQRYRAFGFEIPELVCCGNKLWAQEVDVCGSASRLKPQRCAGLCQSVRVQWLPPLNGFSWTSVLKNYTDMTACVRLCMHLDKRCGILGCHSDMPENSSGILSTYRSFEG